jgi:hypothetical protein
VGEQLGVDPSNWEVVGLHRDRGQQRVHERSAGRFVAAIGELDADQQFGGGDRGDHDVVLVGDDLLDRGRRSLRGDEDRRVEDQALQRRS